MKKLKSRKKIIQRGGWEIRLTDDMIDTFRNPNKFPDDCCPCVFHLLKAPRHAIEELYKSHNFYIKGMENYEIEAFYKKLRPDLDFEFSVIIEPHNIVGWQRKIFGNIRPGFATLGGLERTDYSRHCIVFAKDLRGKIYLFDPQLGEIKVGARQIKSYLQDNNTNYIYKLLSKPAVTVFPPKSSAFAPKSSTFSLFAPQAEGSRIMWPPFDNPWIYNQANLTLIENVSHASYLNELIDINHIKCFKASPPDGLRFYFLMNKGKPIGFLSDATEISPQDLTIFSRAPYLIRLFTQHGVRSIWSVCKITESAVQLDIRRGVCKQLLKMYIDEWLSRRRERFLYLWVRTQQDNINYGAIKCYLHNGFRFVGLPILLLEAEKDIGNKLYRGKKFEISIKKLLTNNRLTAHHADGEYSLMIFDREIPPARILQARRQRFHPSLPVSLRQRRLKPLRSRQEQLRSRQEQLRSRQRFLQMLAEGNKTKKHKAPSIFDNPDELPPREMLPGRSKIRPPEDTSATVLLHPTESTMLCDDSEECGEDKYCMNVYPNADELVTECVSCMKCNDDNHVFDGNCEKVCPLKTKRQSFQDRRPKQQRKLILSKPIVECHKLDEHKCVIDDNCDWNFLRGFCDYNDDRQDPRRARRGGFVKTRKYKKLSKRNP